MKLRKRTPESMEEMKRDIRAFFEKYDAGYRNIESIPPNTLGWLRRALETDDLEEFYKYVRKVGYQRGVIDALYGLQLYFEGEE